MSDVLDKLTSYNLFNYLLPGVLFAAIGDAVTSFTLLHKEVAVGVFLYYFYGLVISRIGSILIAPALRKTGFIKFSPYKDFLSACKIDEKIEVLSEANNTYRTLVAMFAALLVLLGLDLLVVSTFLEKRTVIVVSIAALMILFAFAYRKQTSFIRERIEQSAK